MYLTDIPDEVLYYKVYPYLHVKELGALMKDPQLRNNIVKYGKDQKLTKYLCLYDVELFKKKWRRHHKHCKKERIVRMGCSQEVAEYVYTQWLESNVIPLKDIVANENIEVFDWMISKGFRLGNCRQIVKTLIQNKNWEILKRLYLSGTPYSNLKKSETLGDLMAREAFEHRRMDIIQWLFDHPVDGKLPDTVIEDLIKANYLDKLKEIHLGGVTFDKKVVINCVKHGQLEILKWLHQIETPIPRRAIKEAFQAQNLPIFMWLSNQGQTCTTEWIMNRINIRTKKFIKKLLKNGYPDDIEEITRLENIIREEEGYDDYDYEDEYDDEYDPYDLTDDEIVDEIVDESSGLPSDDSFSEGVK